MTTNQTIDGVPRDLAERFAQYAESGKVAEPGMVEELRAMLVAPEPLWNPHPAMANLAALLIKLAQHGVKVSGGKGDEPWTVEPALKYQGDPVYFANEAELTGGKEMPTVERFKTGYCTVPLYVAKPEMVASKLVVDPKCPVCGNPKGHMGWACTKQPATLSADRPAHANPPPGTEPCGTHHDNDGLDDYRKPEQE